MSSDLPPRAYLGAAKTMFANLGGIFAVWKPRGHHGGNGPRVGVVLLLLLRVSSRSFVSLCRWKLETLPEPRAQSSWRYSFGTESLDSGDVGEAAVMRWR
jgi:hypothetical protein